MVEGDPMADRIWDEVPDEWPAVELDENGHIKEEVDPSLLPVDLGPIIAGDHRQPEPTMLTRDDGRQLLYPGSINGLHGDSGAGKGWVICHLIRENSLTGRRTLILDFEDSPHSIVARLMILGMTAYDIERWLVYVRPMVPLSSFAVEHVAKLVKEHNIGLVVIDSIGEAFALEAIDENKDAEVGPWYRRVARPLADAGPAVWIIDHSTKANDNPLHPSGSKRKRAAITGASYLLESITPFVKGKGGRVRLTCAKDRHGNWRRGEVVGDVVMISHEHRVILDLYAPSAAVGDATVPILIAAKAATRILKDEGAELSQKALLGLLKMKAAKDVKTGGIDLAVTRGSISERPGPRASRLFTYVQDFDAGDGETNKKETT